VAETWAHQDPAGASRWFVGLDEIPQEAMTFEVFSITAAKNPALAASALDQIPAGMIRNKAARRTGSSWAASDRFAALAWMLQQ